MTVVARRRCASELEARRLAAAVAADNPPYVHVAVEDGALVVRVRAPTAGSARTTLDDLLACLAAAERAGP
ncbi:MAG TPA: KEOPS complex subunit Pcc1 [Thermoplasmata archaeon]|nr:KEOPS complex subunit Pcc1 [Thermoplasmata archaeon]